MAEQKRIVIVLFMLSLLFLSGDSRLRDQYRDDGRNSHFRVPNFIGLVAEHGRRAEWHNVTTEDGYILSIFRIVRNNNNYQLGPPIYLQHGLTGTADMFAMVKPERNIAFLLADAGYDVWLGNLRGNAYSRKHKTLSTKDPKFWNFSMDEYAIKDLPAMMDYVLNVTNRSSLSYIGISLGTTISTIFLSNRTDYNSKLNLVVHFAPVTVFKSKTLTRQILLMIADLLEGPDKSFEILPRNRFVHSFVKLVCTASPLMRELCLFLVETFMGRDREQFDIPWDLVLKFALYFPAGCSAKVLFHYFQFLRTGEFGYFDHHDDSINLQYYGKKRAPQYNLSNIVAPMVFFKALNDPLSTLEDDVALIKKLPPNTTLHYEIVNWKNFNHIDFILAKDVKKLVYDRLFEILSDINKFP
ncbi:lipase 1-like [Fopius arisanus]|uniref:Lipase n=1 Tax=Fopius arisanus TaxID=64838 RepID=A0A9R1U1P2_9HYME|nr:PREDICTED: lipase 1-like [Fopius arisanus]